MTVVGLGGLLNDAAAALAVDGQIVAAVEQKKIARHTSPGALPVEAIQETLRLGKRKGQEIDIVALARPFAAGPDSMLTLRVRQLFPQARFLVVDHHIAHAKSAVFSSTAAPEGTTVLTLDRAGDLRCAARFRWQNGALQLERESYFPDSVGDLYGRTTEFLGYRAKADEHKVQWLSTSGDERFVGLFESILSYQADHWPQLDRSFLDQDRLDLGGFSSKFYGGLGLADGESPAPALHAHIAAGLQLALERCVAAMAGEGSHLRLAGGVAFNALLVRSLETSGRWQSVVVQAAAGNAGTALGAALYASSNPQPIQSLALGPEYSTAEIKQVVENCKLSPKLLGSVDELLRETLLELEENRIVAWMQGPMEFGPRALGRRSILANPHDPYATENLNSFIKHRESFRKFAASVPAEAASTYFEFGENAKYLASVAEVRPEWRPLFASALLGEKHIRLHLVEKEENPLFHRLLTTAAERNGLPVLYNTSFNLFGDALVATPRDAVRSFYSSGIDTLVAGQYLLRK
ncbi:MAG: carbamoyltransferase C-terminal domain-containing protein [Bryobacter sp.]|nr:carbamoyltransferase C-terminal domain-containing protein [Bryobacter sp.]